MTKQFNENSITFNDSNDNIDYISMLADTSFLDSNLDSKKCDIDYIDMLADTSFLDSSKE